MSSMRDPMKNAIRLGSAKHGVHHFMVQRITAIGLLVLCVWFLAMVLSLLGSDYASARLTLAQPFNAFMMITFVIVLFWHGQLGLQVIVEDYVHRTWLQFTLQITIRILCFLAGIAGVLAVLRVALGS